MPRKKSKRGGVDNGPSGRRGHPGNKRPGRGAWRQRQQDPLGASDDEQGVLHIGRVMLQVDDSGHVLSRQRKGSQRQAGAAVAAAQRCAASPNPSSDSGSESDSSMEGVVKEYLRNLEGGGSSDKDDEDKEEGGGSGRGKGDGSLRKRLKLLRRFSRVDLGDFDDSDFHGGGPSSSGSEIDSEASSVTSSSSGNESEDDSSSSGDAGREEGGEKQAWERGVLTVDDLEGLSLEQRFPVQARLQLPALPGQKQAWKQQQKKNKAGVKGAKGGKLAPGEKARLRKERITAKRAARAAGRGFDLAVINKDLQDLVYRRGDMKAFPPMGKHECKAVQRLAALYGLKSGVQGGAKHKFVVVTVTERSALPAGEALLQVGRMLTAQFAYEVNGSAILEGPAAAAAAMAGAGKLAPGGSGKGGRWAGIRGARGGGSGGSGAAQAAAPPKKAKKRKVPRPVSFVSGGAINPDESVEVFMPAPPLARVPRPDSDAVLASEPSSASLDSERGRPTAAALGQQRPPAAAAEEEGWGWPGGAGLGSGGAAGLGFGSGTAAAAEQPGAGAVGLLEVYEDRRGSESEDEGPATEGATSDAHPGLGSRRMVVYTRVTAAGLAGQALVGPQALRCAGVGPGEGVTNTGRLLGLGLALGVGPQVFGAPHASPRAGRDSGDEGPGAADLLLFSPLLSRSEQRRRARRRSSPAAAAAAPAPGAAGGLGREEQEGAMLPQRTQQQQQQQQQQTGRGKKGRQRVAAALAAVQQQQWLQQEEEAEDAAAAAQPSPLVFGEYGFFERHTTGIGSKLLAKWGFGGEGRGLGRGGRGIAEPVQASRRAKGLGLGAQK